MQYYKDEPALINAGGIVDFPDDTDIVLFN